MRTKALLCAAALAAGAATSMAQNVYSLNVVGYVNLTLPVGYTLVGNPLDLDGSGTNNTVATVFGATLPVGSAVYTWNGTGYNIASYSKNKAGTATNWSPVIALNPGTGAWVGIPNGSGTQTATVVGNVLQGALVNSAILPGGGYSLVSSVVPVTGGLQTALGYKPALNDATYQWNGTGYNISSYTKNKAGTATNWGPSEPSIAVGEGFWLSTVAGQVWSNNFTVQ